MKELFHSRRFRRNLYKWLSMYVGVMLICTAVVTYSRYISRMQSSTEAKVARFEVEIKHNGCPGDVTSTNVCNSGSFRPNSEIEYQFSVDTSKLDVHANFVLTIIVHPDFEILGLNDMDISQYKNNRISLFEEILTGKGSVKDYTLTIIYRGEDLGKTYDKQIVTVDYAAEQVD